MLNSELRIRTGLSYSASSHFDRLLQPGHWALSSFTQTETTIQALDLALATLDKLHQSGLDPTMLESGKSYVQGQYPLALETSAQWAAQLATLEFYGLDRSYIDDYSAALAGVTRADAKRVDRRGVPVQLGARDRGRRQRRRDPRRPAQVRTGDRDEARRPVVRTGARRVSRGGPQSVIRFTSATSHGHATRAGRGPITDPRNLDKTAEKRVRSARRTRLWQIFRHGQPRQSG